MKTLPRNWMRRFGVYYWHGVHGLGVVWSEDEEYTWRWSYDDGEIEDSGSGFTTAVRAMAVCESKYNEAVHNLSTRVRHA